MSALERIIAESRSRSYGYLAGAKARESTGEGLLLSAAGAMGGGVGGWSRPAHQMGQAREQLQHFNGSFYSAARPILQTIAKQPVRVARLDKKNKKTARYANKQLLPGHLKGFAEELDVLEQHPFLDAMQNPNPIMVQWQLLYMLAASLEVTGRGYWWVYDDKDAVTKKPVKQIWPVPPPWIREKHREGELYACWEIQPDAAVAATQVPSEEILYIHFPDPGNLLGSISPLQAMARYIASDEAVAEAQRRGFANGMFPGLAIIIGNMPGVAGQPGQRPTLTREQRQQIMTSVLTAYRGAAHHNDPILLDNLIQDVKPVTMRPRDMDYLQSMTVLKTRVEQGIGVNPIVCGEIQDANRASATTAKDLVNEFAVNPIIALISQCLTKFGRPMFDDDPNVVFYLEEAVATDDDAKRAKQDHLASKGAMAVNEMRQEWGLPPVWWGDVAWIPQGMVPVWVMREDKPRPSDSDLPGAEQREQARQDKLQSLQAQQDRLANNKPATDKPATAGEAAPTADDEDKPGKQARVDRATLTRMAKAFLKLRGLAQEPVAAVPPAISVPVQITMPADVPAKQVGWKIQRDAKTHQIVALEPVNGEATDG